MMIPASNLQYTITFMAKKNLCYYFVNNILFSSCTPFPKVTNILTLSSQFQIYQLCYYHKNSHMYASWTFL